MWFTLHRVMEDLGTWREDSAAGEGAEPSVDSKVVL